jgi:hypothetical protein
MTCAGISSLIVCNRILASTKRAGDAVKTPQPRDENAAARDRAIQQGTDWLTRYFAVGINPGEGSSGFLDYINGMARVGRLSGLRLFGKHDWYRDEAAFLVGGQSSRDGSWQALDVESDKRIATSLALLFLCEKSGSAAAIKVNDAPPLEQKPPSEKSLVSATASGLLDKRSASRPDHDATRFAGKSYLLQQHPVHLSGRATNQEGKPVAGATVYVVANNVYGLPIPVLETCKTDIDGRYDLPALAMPVLELAPRPVPQPIEGKFQVVATAPGSGYTWRRSMSYRPRPRPATAELGTTGPSAVFYEKEPIRVDLHFEPEARVHGRITNDWGEPLKDTQVELGVIRDVRRGDSPNNQMWRCGYLPSSPFAAEGSCAAVRFLPASFLVARTDADGRYESRGLPREAGMVAQVEAGTDYIAHAFSLQTTAGSSGKHISKVGSDGEFNYVFAAPREIRVRVTEERTGTPVAGVAVRGRGAEIQWSGTEAKTGSDGIATLHLAPGKYKLIAEPPLSVPLVRTAKGVIVQEPRTQDVSLALDSAAVALVKAVEAGTGKPVAGAAVFSTEEGARGPTRPQSQTVFIDNR